MDKHQAILLIRYALDCYVDDCISEHPQLQQEVYQAFEVLKGDNYESS